jgi:hypothetical protein
MVRHQRRVRVYPGGVAREIVHLGATTDVVQPDGTAWSPDGKTFTAAVGSVMRRSPLRAVLERARIRASFATWWVRRVGRSVCLGAHDAVPLDGHRFLTTRRPYPMAVAGMLGSGDHPIKGRSHWRWARPTAVSRVQELRVVDCRNGRRTVPATAAHRAKAQQLSTSGWRFWLKRWQECLSLSSQGGDGPALGMRELDLPLTAGDLATTRWAIIWAAAPPGTTEDWELRPVAFAPRGIGDVIARLPFERGDMRSWPRRDVNGVRHALAPTLDRFTYVHDGGLWLFTLRKPIPALVADAAPLQVPLGRGGRR